MKTFQRTSSATDMNALHRNSSATDMKSSQRISSGTDMKAFKKISSATDEEANQGKTEKVEKRTHYETREEWVTDKKIEEEEAVDFKRGKTEQKHGASNRIMKVIQLQDKPLLPNHCRIMKVIELKEDVPTATTSITEEHQRQDIKQKQLLKKLPAKTQESRSK